MVPSTAILTLYAIIWNEVDLLRNLGADIGVNKPRPTGKVCYAFDEVLATAQHAGVDQATRLTPVRTLAEAALLFAMAARVVNVPRRQAAKVLKLAGSSILAYQCLPALAWSLIEALNPFLFKVRVLPDTKIAWSSGFRSR